MNRREFVGNLVGSTVALNLPLIENNNKENPKKLPVVQFENGMISNYDEVPWGKFALISFKYSKRKCHCWVPKDDAFMGYGIPPTRIWGEVELLELRWEDGFRHVIISILPESIEVPANLSSRTIYKC